MHYHQNCAFVESLFDKPLDDQLCLRDYVSCSLIHQDNLVIEEKSFPQADQLLLTLAQVTASRFDLGAQTIQTAELLPKVDFPKNLLIGLLIEIMG